VPSTHTARFGGGVVMLTLFFGHGCEGLWRQCCSATLPRGPDRVSECADGSGLPGKPVAGQFARKLGQRLVDRLVAIPEAFFDIFDNVA